MKIFSLFQGKDSNKADISQPNFDRSRADELLDRESIDLVDKMIIALGRSNVERLLESGLDKYLEYEDLYRLFLLYRIDTPSFAQRYIFGKKDEEIVSEDKNILSMEQNLIYFEMFIYAFNMFQESQVLQKFYSKIQKGHQINLDHENEDVGDDARIVFDGTGLSLHRPYKPETQAKLSVLHEETMKFVIDELGLEIEVIDYKGNEALFSSEDNRGTIQWSNERKRPILYMQKGYDSDLREFIHEVNAWIFITDNLKIKKFNNSKDFQEIKRRNLAKVDPKHHIIDMIMNVRANYEVLTSSNTPKTLSA